MKIISICSFLFAVFFLASCSSGNKEEARDDKQAMIGQIDSMQKQMFGQKNKEFNREVALKGIASYEGFIKKYPNDSLSAEYMFRMSDLLRAVGDHAKAIQYLGQICKDYPDYKKIPDCLFLQGYYYQEFFKDTNSAKEYYKKLLAKYPNHPFADDAQALMSMFGKTDEQMIQEFEKKAKEKKR